MLDLSERYIERQQHKKVKAANLASFLEVAKAQDQPDSAVFLSVNSTRASTLTPK